MLTNSVSKIVEAVCQGSPREMGRIQGASVRAKIHSARAAVGQLEAFRLQQPWWLPFRLYRWLAERRAAAFLQRCGNEALIERLRGIAEGAGVRFHSICLFNALEPLLSSVGGCTACPGACSAVAVRGRRSATGEPMLARNFDYIPLVQPFYTVRDSRPTGKLRALEFTAAPLAGAVDGMNEAGLCITYNYGFTSDVAPAPAPPISIAISEALATSRNVAEAAEHIAARPRTGGGLLMLCDAAGDIASLELSSTRTHLRRPAPGQDVLFHTNQFTSAALREVQIAQDAVYTDAAPTPLRGRRLHQSSEMRDRRFAELLAQTESIGPDELGAIMADHGPSGVGSDYTPCVHSSYWQTTACLQFFPKASKMRVAYSTACAAKFEDVDLM